MTSNTPVWFILLDHSGSMGDTFTGKMAQEFSGRVRESKAKIKLDAAKKSLLEHLSGLGSPSRVSLVEFTSRASIIFDGLSNDLNRLQQVLDTLEPENGTDIAQALEITREYIQINNIRLSRVLVISDGLSELEPATEAARRLTENAIIDVILIDPTNEGELVARAIAFNGSVSAVTSARELSDRIRDHIDPEVCYAPPPPTVYSLPTVCYAPGTASLSLRSRVLIMVLTNIVVFASIVYLIVSLILVFLYPQKDVLFLIDLSASTKEMQKKYPTIVNNYIRENKINFTFGKSGIIYFSTKAKYIQFPNDAIERKNLANYVDESIPIAINEYCHRDDNWFCGKVSDLDVALIPVFDIGCEKCEIVLISNGNLELNNRVLTQKIYDNKIKFSIIALPGFKNKQPIIMLLKKSGGKIEYLSDK